jgi:energy-coupling factor transport system substrate-specific component
MWRYTRMVVLTALTAALYAAVLIPFKGFVIVPGFTEVRPANVIPVVFGILFGPAGAWGAAIGNLIGDFFGTLGIGSVYGFLGNFFFGFIPYKLWSRHRLAGVDAEATMRGGRQIAEFVLTAIATSITCAVLIAWGLEILNLLPFAALGSIITVNNSIAAGVLGPILMLLLYPRVRQMGLLWTDIMEPEDRTAPSNATLGATLTWVGALGALVFGVVTSIGIYGARLATMSFGSDAPIVVVGVGIFVVVLYSGVHLLSGRAGVQSATS